MTPAARLIRVRTHERNRDAGLTCRPCGVSRPTLRKWWRRYQEMPFSTQRFQTDRGQEFFAYKVQERLRDWRIKFRPIRPQSPHLNGKVERVKKAAREEFWSTVDLNDLELVGRLAEWQHFYNWERPHDSLGGLAPIDRVCDRIHDAPLVEVVEAAYDLDKEFIAPREGWPWRRSN